MTPQRQRLKVARIESAMTIRFQRSCIQRCYPRRKAVFVAYGFLFFFLEYSLAYLAGVSQFWVRVSTPGRAIIISIEYMVAHLTVHTDLNLVMVACNPVSFSIWFS